MYTYLRRLLIVLFILVSSINSQAQISLNGRIKAEETQEDLPYVTVSIKGRYVETNAQGYFNLEVPALYSDTLIASYVGFRNDTIIISATRDTFLQLFLSPHTLSTVTITGKSTPHISKGRMHIPVNTLDEIPAIGGVKDLNKSLALLPGIQESQEGSSRIVMRGTGSDKILYVLDGVELYTSEHLLGLLSPISTDALKDVNVYKSAIPTKYGGRLSGLIDMRTKSGNLSERNSKFSIGTYLTSYFDEGPIIKDKLSYMINVRAAYSGLILLPTYFLFNSGATKNFTQVNVADITSKIHYRINKKKDLSLTIHGSQDWSSSLSRETKRETYFYRSNFGNSVISLNYINQKTPSLQFHHKLSYLLTNYKFRVGTKYRQDNSSESGGTKSYIHSTDYKFHLTNTYFKNHRLSAGSQISYNSYLPTSSYSYINDQIIKEIDNSDDHRNRFRFSPIINDQWKFLPTLSISAGIRGTFIYEKSYRDIFLEPRVSLNINAGKTTEYFLAYDRTVQDIHQIILSETETQGISWIPSNDEFVPMTSDQYSVGMNSQITDKISFNLESYYKNIKDLVWYRKGDSFGSSESIFGELIGDGKGKAYGIESLLQYEGKKWSGWLSYTLSWSKRKFDELNNGEWYNFKYGRRQELKVVGMHRLSEKWTFNTSFILRSGYWETAPTGYYAYTAGDTEPYLEEYYDEINNFEMPLYTRLDLGFKKEYTTDNGNKSAWNFTVYNAFLYPNAISMNVQLPRTPSGNLSVNYGTLLYFIPGVSYAIEF